MSLLSLHVDCFGGASVEEAVKELPVLAARLGIWVTCDLNGIHVMADGSLEWAAYDDWRSQHERARFFGFASRELPASMTS